MITDALLGRGAIVAALAVLTASCGSIGERHPDAHLVPEEPGLYAAVNDQLLRLDGEREWEVETWEQRSALPSNVQFIVYDPRLDSGMQPAEEAIELRHVAWVRSRISPEGEIMPITGSRWDVPQGERFKVAMAHYPVADRYDVIRSVPQAPLQDGLYSLQLRAGETRTMARLGVNWAAVDQDRYSANHCVDLYLSAGGGELLPCEEQQALLASRGLQLHLVTPQRQVVDGTEVLLVQGVVVNVGQQSRRIPPLLAEIRDAGGAVLKSWQFVAPEAEIRPGQSVSFETATDPPAGTNTVHVFFQGAPATS